MGSYWVLFFYYKQMDFSLTVSRTNSWNCFIWCRYTLRFTNSYLINTSTSPPSCVNGNIISKTFITVQPTFIPYPWVLKFSSFFLPPLSPQSIRNDELLSSPASTCRVLYCPLKRGVGRKNYMEWLFAR